MAAYNYVRSGQLKIKGDDWLKKKKKGKRKKNEDAELLEWMKEPGAVRHGSWRKVRCVEEIKDRAVFELYNGRYLQALDTGYFTVGDERSKDEGPDPSEVFTIVQISDTKVAIKSGYSRYLSVNSAGEVIGREEAIGMREQWEPVFEDEKFALCASTHRFLTVTTDDKIMAVSEKAKEKEVMTLRTDAPLNKRVKSNYEQEEEEASNDIEEFETNFVKKFQSFSDHRLKVSTADRGSLENAKQEGKLHEALLDRREKMKADRYCK